MDLAQGIELLIVLSCLFAFLGYYAYLFLGRAFLRKLGQRQRKKDGGAPKSTAFIFSNAQDARQAWVQVITRDKTDAGVPAVQTLRNSIMAASFMATTCGLMAVSGILPVLTDPTKVAWLASVADTDPIVSRAGTNGLISTQWKLASAEFMLLLCLLFFLQAIRLWSFLGYYIRVTPADEENRFPMDVTLAVSRRAGHCWSAGVRCFILILPLILWLMGPTSLLVTSVVLLLFLVTTDFVRVHNTTHAAGDVEELQDLHAAKSEERGHASAAENASQHNNSQHKDAIV